MFPQRSTALTVAPHLDVTAADGRGVVVVTESGREVFAGAEYAAVVQSVDRVRSEADIAAAVAANGVRAADAARAMDDLRAARVIIELDDGLDGPEAAYWVREGVRPGIAADRLATARVAVRVAGDIDAAPIHAALSDAGVVTGEDGELMLVLADDYLNEELREHNRDALGTGRPWLLAAPAGRQALVGPVFVPDRGPCWECLAHRLRRHRTAGLGFDGTANRVSRGAPSLASTRASAAAVIATEVARWIVLGRSSGSVDRVRSIDGRTSGTTTHKVMWRPQCPACGEPGASLDMPARPLALADRGDFPALDDGLRTLSPEETFDRLADHVSPITGLVARVVRAGGTHPPRHAYLAGDPPARIHGDAEAWAETHTLRASGKGATASRARTGALCEALERYSGVYSGDEPRRKAALEDLGEAAVHPNAVMGFSAAQYDARAETNQDARSSRTFVPEPFDPGATVEWTPLWSLSRERERLMPTALCYYAARVAGRETCVPDSNGNAAGNNLEEAIVHGLLELVERDHVALWWYNRLRAPGLDLDGFGDSWLESVRDDLAREGRELWALDLTADLGIPVAVALATPAEGGGLAFGFGAHLDLGRALARAVAELIQVSGGGHSGGLGHGPQEPLDSEASSYLRPDPSRSPHGPADSTLAPSGDLRTDLDAFLERIERAGMETMVLDQTRPDVGLPVVKVVVPGLRHFWPRFGPGRLYEVPVAMGRLAEPVPEPELNPVSPVA